MSETQPQLPYREAVNRLAAAMKGALDPGEVAQLRRLDPQSPGGSAFWRTLALYIEPYAPLPTSDDRRATEESAWAAVMRGMAHMAVLHAPKRRLGRALAEADVSELRFNRLMRAEGAPLLDEIASVAHLLASRAVSVDWADLASLVLLRSGDAAERHRRHIARDYYHNLLNHSRKA
jgi:CRISPR system Cascade subunit CasB